MKALLAMPALAAAISLGLSHIAAAQDRDVHANRLFAISEQLQQSGPCGELPFLWLSNEKIIAFLDALASGEYESAAPMLPQYIACFEHQKEVVEIRTVIHAEFPETEAAFKVAEVGYFTEDDIDEFVALLKLAVKPATLDGSKVTLKSRDATLPPPVRLARRATADVGALTDRVQRTSRGTDTRRRTPDELNTRIPLYKPLRAGSPNEEAVAALLKSLDEEVQDSVTRASAGDRVAQAPQEERQSQSNPTLREQETTQVASALAERVRRIRERGGGNRFTRPRLSFAPPRPENQLPQFSAPLAKSHVESIGRHIQDCWVPPRGLRDRQDLTVTIRFGLFPDGSLRTEPTVVEQSRMGSRDFRLTAETAQRAVLECTPLEGLPEASYEQWREIKLAFDPRSLPGPGPIPREAGTLGAGDEVRVTVFGEEDLSGEFKINSNGWISMPLIGGVAAAGRGADQLEASITRALLDGHMKDPHVSIEVLTFQPIFVLGEVNNPGSYPYAAGLTMLKAVALAGGYTTRAKRNVLFLSRDPDQVERKMRTNDRVLPGDTIRVIERWF